jgi:hypothetical protein
VFKFLLALHLLAAIFAIGPLAQAAKSASRGIRQGDGAATAAAARMMRIYAYVSVLVVILGMALMSIDNPFGPGKVGEFKDTWIWLSLVLWLVAVAITLLYLVPTLTKATATIAAEGSVMSLTVRVATAGGLVGLIFAGIVFLMVYRPGS